MRNVYAEVSAGACGGLQVSAGTGELARGVQLQKNGYLQKSACISPAHSCQDTHTHTHHTTWLRSPPKVARTEGVEVIMLEVMASELEIEAKVSC